MKHTRTAPLDKQLVDFFAQAEKAGKKATHMGTVESARESIELRAATAPKLPEMQRVRDHWIDSPHGPTVPVRVYEPREMQRTLVYLHGGGWVSGSVNSFDRVARTLADSTRSRVISVDYRLAPENSYPAGLHDARAALNWAFDHFGSMGPVVVAGDSAGGNLAAVLAQECRDAGIALAAQLLMYPVVDADFSRPSHQEFYDVNYLLNSLDLEWYWDHYAPSNKIDRGASKLSPLNGTLRDVAPTILVIAGHDPLRDGLYEFSKKLEAADVHVSRLDYPEASHGFISLLDVTRQAENVYSDIAHVFTHVLAI